MVVELDNLPEDHPYRSFPFEDFPVYEEELDRTGWLESLEEEEILPLKEPSSTGDEELDKLLAYQQVLSREEALHYMFIGRLFFDELEPSLETEFNLTGTQLLKRLVLFKDGRNTSFPYEAYSALRELVAELQEAELLPDPGELPVEFNKFLERKKEAGQEIDLFGEEVEKWFEEHPEEEERMYLNSKKWEESLFYIWVGFELRAYSTF